MLWPQLLEGLGPRSVRKDSGCLESVLNTRSAGLVRDLRLFGAFTRRVRPDERPQVSDEPCATELGNNCATQRSTYGRIVAGTARVRSVAEPGEAHQTARSITNYQQQFLVALHLKGSEQGHPYIPESRDGCFRVLLFSSRPDCGNQEGGDKKRRSRICCYESESETPLPSDTPRLCWSN